MTAAATALSVPTEADRLSRRDANIKKYLSGVRRIGQCWNRFEDPDEFESWAMLALVELLDRTPETSLSAAFVDTAIRNDLRDVSKIEKAGTRIPKSLIVGLSDPIGDDADGAELTLEDVLADAAAPNAEADVISKDRVDFILSVLPDRQRKVVTRHLGLDGFDSRTMAEVARGMHLSRITIRREYAAAMTTLRTQLGAADLASTLAVLHAV